jgi:hypothetical protein
VGSLDEARDDGGGLVSIARPCRLAGEAKLPAKPGNWQVTMEVDSENLPMKLPR